jgi:Xaa-Pro aminopeptidase
MELAPDFQRRRDLLRKKVRQASLDGLLVTSAVNVAYLTGFTGDSSYLWLGGKKDLIFSDTRFATQLAEECPEIDADIRDSRTNLQQSVQRATKAWKCKSLGIESEHVSKAWYDEVKSSTGCELVDTAGWVEANRAIKDKFEIQKIRNSIKVNERAFEVIKAKIHTGQTERQIAHDLENQIRLFGGEGCAFEPIVGAGARSALPHGRALGVPISESAFVLIDWGAKVDGYVSDLTRVLLTAKIPAKIRKIYQIVQAAQSAAIAGIRPGVEFKEVDGIARGMIHRAGFGNKFGHGLGHGIGLQVHEYPSVSPIRKGVFEPGMVVTVEPGVYLPGFGGIRIEDNVLVTKEGRELLSSLPSELDENIVEF